MDCISAAPDALPTTAQSACGNAPDLVEWTATALSPGHSRSAGVLWEVLEAYLAQIDRLNPIVNSWWPRGAEGLRPRHKSVTRNWPGDQPGPPRFPQAPRDIMPVAGHGDHPGSPIFAGRSPRLTPWCSSACVRVGRCLWPAPPAEFGLGGHTFNPVYGTTRNAFDPQRSAGGSSGGAGVAVALRMPGGRWFGHDGVAAHPLGVQQRVWPAPPLAACPHGPTDEVFFQQFSVAGPMARNIPDLAMLLSVQAGV